MSTCKRFAGLLLLTTALSVPTALRAQGAAGEPNAGPEAVPPSEPEIDAGADALEDVQGVDTAVPGEDAAAEPDISIPGGGTTIVVTGRVNRDPVRRSSQVINVLSTEQIARTGEGDIAGALGRVTGLSLQNNGRVYVRGLGDRYSLSLLNGLPLPSPEPLSRVVPLDIFPTSIVASSLVQKTYSANFPAEFGGGVINLTTRAVPDESFITIGGGLSGDVETTFQKGLAYYGSKTDWTGFDDGARDLPGPLVDFFATGARMEDLIQVEKETIGKSLIDPNFVTLQTIGDLPANWSASASGGTSFDVGDDGQLGIIATASIGNRWRNREIARQTGSFAADGALTLDTDFTDLTTDNRITVNGLLGVGFEIGDHQFRWTNVYIRDTQKQSSLASGEVINSSTASDSSQINQETAWYERQLIDTQLVGELEFDALSIDLRAGFARTDREAPYEYSFTYVRSNRPTSIDPYGDQYINVLNNSFGSASVVFSDLYEELWYGGADLTYEILPELRATVGYAYSDTDRYSERREFQFFSSELGGSNFPLRGIGLLQPRFLLQPSIFDYRAQAEALNAANPNNNVPVFSIDVREVTPNPAFAAALRLHAGYGQLDYEPLENLTINLGVRYEDGLQTVTPVNLFTTPINLAGTTRIANDYFLPAATITYRPNEDLQLRISGSRTLARPQFRELIFQPYTDPETTLDYIGNPSLQDSELLNAEARVEYYLPNRSRLSVAGFFKEIDSPIEPYSQFTDGNQLIQFANAPSAQLYGAEAEFEYNYDLFDVGGWFETKQVVLIANYTYTQSELKVSEGDTTTIFNGTDPVEQDASIYFVDGAPLTGQSDHLVNLQLGLEDIEDLQQITLLVSYASDRVTSRAGRLNTPDVVEDPGFQVDLVVRQGIPLFGLESELKLEARNIFGRGHEEFQGNDDFRLDTNTYDVGQSFAASLSVTF